MKLVVFGGNGFLGRYICKNAATRGWEVTSVSRSGSLKGEGKMPSWTTKVNWLSGDLLQPDSYSPLLKEADAVVHCVGTLFEFDYKSSMNKGLTSTLCSLASSVTSNQTSKANAYEKINFETVKALCDQIRISENKIKALGYVSATSFLPNFVVDKRYIATKRAAEQYLLINNNKVEPTLSTENLRSNKHHLYSLIFRPGLMYSDTRPLTVSLAGLTSTLNQLIPNFSTVNNHEFNNKGLIPSALRVETVAEAIAQALEQTVYKDSVKLATAPNNRPKSQIYGINQILELSR